MSGLEVLTTSQSARWLELLERIAPQHDFFYQPHCHALEERLWGGKASLFKYEEGPYGILLPFLFIAPIALVASAGVGGVVGVLFGIIDLALFGLAGFVAGDAKPTT